MYPKLINRKTLSAAALGALFSLVFPLLGTRFIHFLPRPAILQTLLWGSVGFLIGALLTRRRSLPELIGLSLFFTVIPYYLGWLLYFSHISEISGIFFQALFIFIALGLLILLGVSWNFFPEMPYGKTISVVLIVSLLCIRGFAPMVLSQSTISHYVVRSIPDKTHQSFVKVSLRNLYPFSVPFDLAVERFSPLLPAIPEGKKIVLTIFDAFRNDFYDRRVNKTQVTPTMKSLSKEGIYFPNYRVQGTWTKPSTASLFTGKYIREHATIMGGEVGAFAKRNDDFKLKEGVEDEQKVFGQILPDDFNTLAERLANRGFQTMGSVRIAHINARYNFDQGADEWIWVRGNGDIPADYHSFNNALYWLQYQRPKRAFIYVHFQGPHYPYKAGLRNTSFWSRSRFFKDGKVNVPTWSLPSLGELPETKFSDEEMKQMDLRDERDFLEQLYAAQVNYHDQKLLPRIISGLQNISAYSSSFFILTSDHGEELLDRNYVGHTGGTLHEEVINVPLIIKSPEQLTSNRGQEIPVPVESVDLTASLLDYGEANRDNISGTSFLNLIGNDSSDTDTFRFSFSELASFNNIAKVAAVRSDGKKIIHNYNTDRNKLYDLNQDPAETNPVKPIDQELEESLRGAIKKKLSSDSAYLRPLSPTRKHLESEREALKGLGYLK